LKEFQYRWKTSTRELTGILKAVDRKALEDHINLVGGKLIEVKSEMDLPEKILVPDHPGEIVSAEQPEESVADTNLLSSRRKGKKAHRLILFFGWLTIISGGFISLASLALLAAGFTSGFDWMGTQSSPEEKIFILAILISTGALQLILGTQMLRKPVFGAWLLLFSSFALLVPATMNVLSKRYAVGILDLLLSVFIIIQIVRKRS